MARFFAWANEADRTDTVLRAGLGWLGTCPHDDVMMRPMPRVPPLDREATYARIEPFAEIDLELAALWAEP